MDLLFFNQEYPDQSWFLDEFRSKCNGKFDVSFTAREDSGEAAGKLKRLEQLERFAEMKILTPADGAKESYNFVDSGSVRTPDENSFKGIVIVVIEFESLEF